MFTEMKSHSPHSHAFQTDFGWTRFPTPTLNDLNGHIYISQNEDPHRRNTSLIAALHSIRHEDGQTDSSALRLLCAAYVLRNLAWYPGIHLQNVVLGSKDLMIQNLTLIRETAVGAVKNAAYFEGSHIPLVINFVTNEWPSSTVRMRNDSVRGLVYASRHSRESMQTDNVRRFLEDSTKNENPIIHDTAQVAIRKIFN